MKLQSFKQIVEETCKSLDPEKIQKLKDFIHQRTPPQLVSTRRMNLRRSRLIEVDILPSPVDLERILGKNDLVDVNYLARGLTAARAVSRIILRDQSDREIGYGTGFKVAPNLLITNHHVFVDASVAECAICEFDYELDLTGLPRPTTRFRLDPKSFFLNDPTLDFALVGILPTPIFGDGCLNDYGFLRLIREEGKINPGEFVSIIQHPSGLPKQIAIRENELLAIKDLVLWYQSDTAKGSSGASVLNDSWQVVGLHHSGVPKKDEKGNWLLKNGQIAGPDADDGDIDWLANEGIRTSRIVNFVEENTGNQQLRDQFLRAVEGDLVPEIKPVSWGDTGRGSAIVNNMEPCIDAIPGGARVTLPLSFTITIDGIQGAARKESATKTLKGQTVAAAEKIKIPVIDADYTNRKGYDPQFLGIEVPLPTVKNPDDVALQDNGEHAIPYEHFSIVMDKIRRLALFTASNVDGSMEKKEPEPDYDYSRQGLGGMKEHDTEQWITDPRIPSQCQLPDFFYQNDNGAFDRGHIVRREDVCWGDSYEQVRRANGDSFHTTNCSPQVGDFNRIGKIWAKLENFILKQAKSETYCLFAGPLLQEDDQVFVGVDDIGEARIQIPHAFWKIVVASAGNEIQAFAFLLEQDLSSVPLEFAVTAQWAEHMVSIKDLEGWIGKISFPQEIVDADQFKTNVGEKLLKAKELQGLQRGRKKNTNAM